MSKQFHPHAARTASSIGERLTPHLPASGRILELASGSGQLVVALAAKFPALIWIPSELEPGALASIAAYRAEATLGNLATPEQLDVRALPWPVTDIAVVLAVRLLHVLAATDLVRVFTGARGSGATRVIVIGPLADRAGEPGATPAHLQAWCVPIRIPSRDELAAAAARAGLRWIHDERIEDDTLVVFDAPA